jgi:hypothetical protein
MSKTGAIAAFLFLAGCVVGGVSSQFVVPPARAQDAGARWDYFCFNDTNGEEVSAKLNDAGAQGWQLVSVSSRGSHNFEALFCMSRRR